MPSNVQIATYSFSTHKYTPCIYVTMYVCMYLPNYAQFIKRGIFTLFLFAIIVLFKHVFEELLFLEPNFFVGKILIFCEMKCVV